MERRVVVTGMGVVSPVGNNVADFWDALINGASGVDRVTHFDATHFDCRIAGEIKSFDPQKFMSAKECRRTDRFVQLALAAAKEAVDNAGLVDGSVDPDVVGVLVGTGVGGLSTIEEQHAILLEKGPGRVSPFLIPMMLSNMASGHVSMQYGFRGPNNCVVTACATSTHAVGDAFALIRRGAAKVMVCGGAEGAITPLGFAGFCAMRAMSTRNDNPKAASRPFDRERDGFVMGEGAGVLVLEDEEHARRRGVRIYAEVAGYGMSSDAHHITAPAPNGRGLAEAIKHCLADARLAPDEIDYFNAHGTSTPANDKEETAAIKTVFGDHARRMAISSTKSMTGHLLGAAGGIELVATIKALEQDIIPPTINLENPDPDCDLDYTPNSAVSRKAVIGISASAGFGGHNSTVIVKEYNH